MLQQVYVGTKLLAIYTEKYRREEKSGTFFIGQPFFYWSVNVDDEKGNRINFSIYKKLGNIGVIIDL